MEGRKNLLEAADDDCMSVAQSAVIAGGSPRVLMFIERAKSKLWSWTRADLHFPANPEHDLRLPANSRAKVLSENEVGRPDEFALRYLHPRRVI